MQTDPTPALTGQNVYVLDFVLIALRKKEVCCRFPHQWFVGETLWGKAHREIGKKRFTGWRLCRSPFHSADTCRSSHGRCASLGPVGELAAGCLNVLRGCSECFVSFGGGRAIVIKNEKGRLFDSPPAVCCPHLPTPGKKGEMSIKIIWSPGPSVRADIQRCRAPSNDGGNRQCGLTNRWRSDPLHASGCTG